MFDTGKDRGERGVTAKGWPKREKVMPYRSAANQRLLGALRKGIGEMIA